ncbi:MAG: Flp pilus assembly complex ATPase component TadA [Clostridia bacterium]|nr:Flp pilus assembly complex ATPase component TadA [Clostridia bacterium]
MKSEFKFQVVKETAEYFPEKLKQLICNLPQKTLNSISEIRLRADRPLSITLNGENVFLAKAGHICYLSQHGLYVPTKQELEEIFINMCEHSVYAYAEQIKHGYINLKNGCRAGLAASAVYENGKIKNFSYVSSINIRIAAEVLGCALPIANVLNGGLLIAGPPSSGKTTLLRDAVRLISNGISTARRRVTVIDTRGEIAASDNGVPSVDLGALTDVISGCEKAEGINIALRTLSPQVIAFDELADLDEVKAVVGCFHAGCDALCTVHIGSVEELIQREASRALLQSGVIKYVVFLSAVGEPAEIFSVSLSNGEVGLEPSSRGVALV